MDFYTVWQNAATDPLPLTIYFLWNWGLLPIFVIISAIGTLLSDGR